MSAPASFRERLLDLLWAACTLGLAIPFIRDAWEQRDLQAGIYFSLHLQAAFLFLVRRNILRRPDRPLAYAVALASTFYVYLFRFDEGRSLWPPSGPTVTLTGSLLCFAAVLSLGRSYGVLPAVRRVETQGLYRMVRHPVYASYLVMDAGILLEHSSLWNLGVYLLGFGLFLGRIQQEEILLYPVEPYRAYSQAVRWRLLPGIY